MWAGIAVLMLSSSPSRAQTPARSNGPAIETLRRTVDSLQALLPGKAVAGTNQAHALAVALIELAEAHQAQRNEAGALEAFRQSITYASQARDSTTLANARSGLGLVHWRRNQYDSALTHLAISRDIRAALDDRAGLARVLNSIGASNYQLGNYEPALDAFVQALEYQREQRDSANIARILTNIGKTYHDWRQYERARRVLEEAAATAAAVDSQVIRGYALNSLAMLAIDMGDYPRAHTLIEQSNAAYHAKGHVLTTQDSLSAWSLNTAATGLLAIREGRPAQGIPYVDSLLAAGRRSRSARGQARALLYLGEAYRALGTPARAKVAFTHSLEFSRSVHQRVLALDALRQLAALEESGGNAGTALRHLHSFLALRDTIFDQSAAQRIAAMEARAETQREQRENSRLREKQRGQTVVIARQRLIGALGIVILLLTAMLLALLAHFNRKERTRGAALAQVNADLATANAELRTALSEVDTLAGLIPICASCKKVRDDKGYWDSLEAYIASRSKATFSHSICQTCGPKLYGEYWPREAGARQEVSAAADAPVPSSTER